MGRRRKKRRAKGEVELNLAAMLDMAFQLLTFFILTFKPAPVEGQVSLRLPPPRPVTQLQSGEKRVGSDESKVLEGLNTLTVTALPRSDGSLGQIAVGDQAVGGLSALDTRLRTMLNTPGVPFEQVIIQVGSGLRYDALMSVIDVCTRQKLQSGEPLTKLSFVELPDAAQK